ncbi:MAG: hypothetical protein VZR53_15600 [Prevotella sp.]|nr:hypothetical protein [Prevotella sp.]
MIKEQSLEIFQEEQIRIVEEKGRNWLRVSFPNENYNPIFMSYVKKPTVEEISSFLKSLNYNIVGFRIIGKEYDDSSFHENKI